MSLLPPHSCLTRLICSILGHKYNNLLIVVGIYLLFNFIQTIAIILFLMCEVAKFLKMMSFFNAFCALRVSSDIASLIYVELFKRAHPGIYIIAEKKKKKSRFYLTDVFWDEWHAEFGHNSRSCWTVPLHDQATHETRWWVVLVCLRTVNVPVVYDVVHDDPRQTLSGRSSAAQRAQPWRIAAQMEQTGVTHSGELVQALRMEKEIGRDPDRWTGRFCVLRLNVWASCCKENDSISSSRCSDLKREPSLARGLFVQLADGLNETCEALII